LLRLAWLLTQDAAIAEEIIYDAFGELHGSWHRLGNIGEAATCLRRGVVSRTRSVQRYQAAGAGGPQKPPPDAFNAGRYARPALGYAAVLTALHTLPGRQREALVLRYYGDLPEAQAASAMGINRAALRSHTAHGMAALRRILN
jgi:DNA-directed RNA polymerase specialized sigma24 family protein